MRLRTANRCIALLRRLLLLPLLLPLLLLLLLLSLPSLPPLFTVVRHLPLVASLLLVNFNFNFNLNLNRLVLLHITTATTLFLTALSRLLPRSILQPLPPLLRTLASGVTRRALPGGPFGLCVVADASALGIGSA